MQINAITEHYAKNNTVSKGMWEAYHHKWSSLSQAESDTININNKLIQELPWEKTYMADGLLHDM